MKNDRLYKAVKILLLDEDNIKLRVVKACDILQSINRNELSEHLFNRLKSVLKEASKNGPRRNEVTGAVISGAFVNTAINRHRKTYIPLAKEIYDIYIENEGCNKY